MTNFRSTFGNHGGEENFLVKALTVRSIYFRQRLIFNLSQNLTHSFERGPSLLAGLPALFSAVLLLAIYVSSIFFRLHWIRRTSHTTG